MRPVVHDRDRGEVAQRWGSILVGLAVVFVAGWMTLEAMTPRPPKATVDAALDASAITTNASPLSAADAAPPEDLDAGLFLASPSLSFGDAGSMPSGAPRHVKIGVVLVAFAGAEGASASVRSKPEAQGIAERLAQEARADFHQAVRGGDPGSADDIGRLPRGVLDPHTEVAVFALAAGEVSEVLETPKGYWIVKRIE